MFASLPCFLWSQLTFNNHCAYWSHVLVGALCSTICRRSLGAVVQRPARPIDCWNCALDIFTWLPPFSSFCVVGSWTHCVFGLPLPLCCPMYSCFSSFWTASLPFPLCMCWGSGSRTRLVAVLHTWWHLHTWWLGLVCFLLWALQGLRSSITHHLVAVCKPFSGGPRTTWLLCGWESSSWSSRYKQRCVEHPVTRGLMQHRHVSPCKLTCLFFTPTILGGARVYSRLCTQGSLLVVLEEYIWGAGVKSGSATCKTDVLFAVLCRQLSCEMPVSIGMKMLVQSRYDRI